ncbi:MAG: AMP-binding protein, partial [Pseudomonadota bacterium]
MQDETGLERGPANFVALTPLSHLNRAAGLWPDREAVIHGDVRIDYRTYRDRVTRQAAMLAGLDVAPGDVVATLLPNVPAQVEASFGVPACGAVLNTINTRLDVDTVAYILSHGGASVLLVDTAFLDLAEAACATLGRAPKIVEVPD